MTSTERISISRAILMSLRIDIDNLATKLNDVHRQVHALAIRPSIEQDERLRRRREEEVGVGGTVPIRQRPHAHPSRNSLSFRSHSNPWGPTVGLRFDLHASEDSMPPTPPIPSRSPPPSSSRATAAGPAAQHKHKQPEVHLRGGGGYPKSRKYAGKHGTPSVTRAPRESLNQTGDARRGARRGRRVRPTRNMGGDGASEGDDVDDDGDEGMDSEVEEGGEGGESSEEVEKYKEEQGVDNGKGEEGSKGKGKERAV